MNTIDFCNDKVLIGISDNSDGNMRHFPNTDESAIIRNQSNLCAAIVLNPDSTARINTTYGDRKHFTQYAEITSTNIQTYSIKNPEHTIPATDGLTTKLKNTGILLPLADCLGIVVYDERQSIIGLLHAGRHNVEQNGPVEFIRFMAEKYQSQPEELKIYFSPCARNYQVHAFGNKHLPAVAREQLLSTGILPSNITESEIDVVSDHNYPSFSRGDKEKRFAVVVKMQ